MFGDTVLFFGVLTFLWTLNRADAVDCVLMRSCILPCTFQPGEDVVIHWYQVTTGDTPVHSYYHNQDQTALQNQRFRGRTSLFNEQISRGNASLQLTRVQIQDQDSYKCYTSTIAGNEESIIRLNVNDPVHTRAAAIIAGVGGVALLFIIVVIIIYCKKSGRRKDRNNELDVTDPLREQHITEHELETNGPNGPRTSEELLKGDDEHVM